MECSQKIAALAKELMEELANLSKQRKPLTADLLREALEKRKSVLCILEGDKGKEEEACTEVNTSETSATGLSTESEKSDSSGRNAPGGGYDEALKKVFRRMGVILAVAAKQERDGEVNDCLDMIKSYLKSEDVDPCRLSRLLDHLRDARLRRDSLDAPTADVAPIAVKRMKGVETTADVKELELVRERADLLAERLRSTLERVVGQLSIPDNQEFSEQLYIVARKLGQNPSSLELEMLDQRVHELLGEFRKEVAKERDNMSGMLLGMIQELMETERQFLRTLLGDRKKKREGEVQIEEALRENVQTIELSMNRVTDVTKLQEMVRKGLNGIRLHIVDWRTRQEEQAQESEIRIARLRSRLKKSGQELTSIQRMAEEDPLTGVMNRRSMERHLKRILEECEQSDLSSSFIMLDIDHFKKINDTYGHLNGDKVLAAMCKVLCVSLRQNDLVFRYGGEEFSVIIPGSDIGQAGAVAEKIRILVKNMEFVSKGSRVPVTVSLGVTELRTGDTMEAVIQRADEALYKAKQGGRDRVEVKS